MRRVLLSIRPEYVDMIFNSDKTVELRKKIPALGKGDELLVYASSPTMALVGAVEVLDVVQDSPSHLWKLVKSQAGVERDFYDAYYRDHDTAYGILLGKTRLFEAALPLQALRAAWPGFTPPQSYRYIDVYGTETGSVVETSCVEPKETSGRYALHVRK